MNPVLQIEMLQPELFRFFFRPVFDNDLTVAVTDLEPDAFPLMVTAVQHRFTPQAPSARI